LVDFLGIQSLLVIVFTFGVGYIVTYFGYRFARKLHIWHKLVDFDKAMRTFIIGGSISWIVFVSSNAPIESSSVPEWWHWLLQAPTVLWFILLIGVTTFYLWLALSKS